MYILSEAEFEIKYKLYAQELMNVFYGYTKDKCASEDIIQNVFIKFLNCNKVFSNQNGEKYWLIRVAINECKNHLRRKKKIVINEEVIEYISPKVDEDDETYIVSKIVKDLPEKYRSVIILFYYDSLSIDEISEALKLSEANVKKRLERARKMIKVKLEEGYVR